jgi:hypothetical protein
MQCDVIVAAKESFAYIHIHEYEKAYRQDYSFRGMSFVHGMYVGARFGRRFGKL